MPLGVKTTSHNKMLFHLGATVGGSCSSTRITKFLQDLNKANKTISETLKKTVKIILSAMRKMPKEKLQK